MRLNKTTLAKLDNTAVQVPASRLLELPEKVIQFGTGVLLRGLPDYFIDKANKLDLFQGRVVMVKSTDTPGADAFTEQDGLYTQVIRGLESDRKIDECVINAAISRVLSARTQWQQVLELARNPAFELIISNTTEAGLVLDENDQVPGPVPSSFPGKLLAFLYERWKHFQGDGAAGMVIVPTELVPDNGDVLRTIVIELSRRNRLGPGFEDWLLQHNHFCNSLVDRIVPGKLPAAAQSALEQRLGYEDPLMIMSEPYRLWAIESDAPRVKQVLSFAAADPGVIVTPRIEKFRELKLRLLNGTHTFCCGLAHLAGFDTVKQAIQHPAMRRFIEYLMVNEIGPSIPHPGLTRQETDAFTASVMDRFANPFIDHRWLSIAVNYSSKMKTRNVALIEAYYKKFNRVPAAMAVGFAAFIAFMKPAPPGAGHTVEDPGAAHIRARWEEADGAQVVEAVLGDEERWGLNLAALPGFSGAVKAALNTLLAEHSAEWLQSIVPLQQEVLS